MNWKRLHHLYIGILCIFCGFFPLYLNFPYPLFFLIILLLGLFLFVDDFVYHLVGASLISEIVPSQKLMIITTFPNEQEAKEIIQGLLEKKLIACSNRFSTSSMYWWEGKIETAEETCALLKTTREHFSAVTNYITHHHSYDVPQILKLELSGGSKEYLAYIESITST